MFGSSPILDPWVSVLLGTIDKYADHALKCPFKAVLRRPWTDFLPIECANRSIGRK